MIFLVEVFQFYDLAGHQVVEAPSKEEAVAAVRLEPWETAGAVTPCEEQG